MYSLKPCLFPLTFLITVTGTLVLISETKHSHLLLQDCLFHHSPQRALRSADQHLLRIPSPKEIKQASTRARAFSALTPAWWNALPSDIRALWELNQFLRACKTELFCQAYS